MPRLSQSADANRTASHASLSRRALLQMSGQGLGTIALAWLLESQGLLGSASAREATSDVAPTGQPALDLTPKPSHFPARAKAVVMFVQNGGPSQMEIFDPKPELNKRDGQLHSQKVEMFQLGSEQNKLLGCPFKFHRRGESGLELSEVIPRLGALADEMCLVRSMFSEHANHTEALVHLSTGKIFQGRPALGSWISYGLGTENQNLPAYIVLRDPAGYNTSGTLLWQSGWLPALYRGTEFSSQGAPVLNLSAATPTPRDVQQDNLDFLARLNERHRREYPRESELETRIRNFELAARMQLAAGQALDLNTETEATRKQYGLDNPTTAGYGTRCLMARRLIEQGVRFVQIHPPVGQPWDAHGNVKDENEKICGQTDLPAAALIQDLKQRGLLDTTIVLWSGEFGRLPVSQNGKGRDHNRNAFSLFLAGGGFKAGFSYGATDDVGYKSVEQRVSVNDLHATILHQLGLDHDQLTYRHHGRDETLTDSVVTGATVVTDLLASTPA